MELNREQIVKALECCYTNNLDCSDCPFQATDKYMECAGLTLSALTLIKELTEENERLKELATTKEVEKEIVRKETKADTVQKMQARIDRNSSSFLTMSNGIVTSRTYQLTEDKLEQIAKEILEGN